MSPQQMLFTLTGTQPTTAKAFCAPLLSIFCNNPINAANSMKLSRVMILPY